MHLAFFFPLWFLFRTLCYLMTLPKTYDENVKRMKDVVTSVCAVFVVFLVGFL